MTKRANLGVGYAEPTFLRKRTETFVDRTDGTCHVT